MDGLGHANQGVIFNLFMEARAHLLRPLGDKGDNMVMARADVSFEHEIRYANGYIDVTSQVSAVGRSSVAMDQTMLLPDGTVAARCTSVAVAWDKHERRSRSLDDRERELLEPRSGQRGEHDVEA